MSATNRGAKRNKSDFYATPSWCTKSLLEKLDLTMVNSFCEPCVGDGAIYDLIDVPDKQWYEINNGKNYLTASPERVDLIITNPPYSQALSFIAKAFSHSSIVIMLLRLNFLEAQSRFHFWQFNPPSHIVTLSKRPSFTGKGTDATGYAWVIWNGDAVMKNTQPFQWTGV